MLLAHVFDASRSLPTSPCVFGLPFAALVGCLRVGRLDRIRIRQIVGIWSAVAENGSKRKNAKS
jgi:hypothetical protein